MKKKGFTVVELVVVIALSAIILLALTSVFSVIATINNDSNDLSYAQRLAQSKMQIIKNQLRNANYLDVMTAVPDTPSNDSNYLYTENGKVVIKYAGTPPSPISSDKGFENYKFTLSFKQFDSRVIEVNVTIHRGDEKLYFSSSKVYINNLGANNITGETTGNCIAFKEYSSVFVSDIIISSPENSITINGATLQLSAEVYPNNATNKGVAWSVDNMELASISQDGVLTPLKNSIVIVKASALDGSAVFDTKQIIISNQNITISKLDLKASTSRIKVNESLKIISEITPFDATNQKLTWNVDDTSLASISQDGVLTANLKKNKSVIVTATTNDGSNLTATIEILIK